MAVGDSDPVDIVRDAALDRGSGGWLTAAVSGTALLASGVSLWESALKQPEIQVHVADSVSYTRDPYGSFEVVAVPLTIQNSGARDAAVVSLSLDITNASTGQTDRFVSAYVADASYFGARDDVAQRLKRPKLPFAPIAVAGRSAYSGTLLFYPPEYKEQRLLEPKAKVTMTLRLAVPPPSGWLETWMRMPAQPISISAEVPAYLPGALLTGDVVRLKSAVTRP